MYRLYMAIAEDFWILPAGNLTDVKTCSKHQILRWMDFEFFSQQSHMQTKATTDGSFLSPCWWHKGHPICQTTQKTIKAFLVKGPSSNPQTNFTSEEGINFYIRKIQGIHEFRPIIRRWSKKSIFEAMSFRRVFQQFASRTLSSGDFVGSQVCLG